MLLDCCYLWVNGLDARARIRRATNSARVALERAVDERIDHALNITGGFRVRERLVSCRLLQAVRVLLEERVQHDASTRRT